MMKLVYWSGKHFPTFLFSSPVLKYNFIFFKELIQEYSEEGALNHHSCDGVLNFVWNQVHVLSCWHQSGNGQGKKLFTIREKSGNSIVCQRKLTFWKGKEKWKMEKKKKENSGEIEIVYTADLIQLRLKHIDIL